MIWMLFVLGLANEHDVMQATSVAKPDESLNPASSNKLHLSLLWTRHTLSHSRLLGCVLLVVSSSSDCARHFANPCTMPSLYANLLDPKVKEAATISGEPVKYEFKKQEETVEEKKPKDGS